MDIQQELDRVIGSGPASPTPNQRLCAGRAALRRRRLVLGAGAAAVVAALAFPMTAIGGGGADRGTEPPPAARLSDTPSTSEPAREPSFPEPEKTLAYVDFDTGRLVIQPGVAVLRRVDDLYPGEDIRSVALDVRRGEDREWIVLEWTDRGGAMATSGPDDRAFDSFDDFVADVVSSGPVQSGPPVGPEGPP